MVGHCLLHIRDGEVDDDVDAVDGLHGYASRELCRGFQSCKGQESSSLDEYNLQTLSPYPLAEPP